MDTQSVRTSCNQVGDDYTIFFTAKISQTSKLKDGTECPKGRPQLWQDDNSYKQLETSHGQITDDYR